LDPRFTLDQLVVLDAIARHGTYVAAAKELRRVTSAVSYSVNCLERAVGVTLFEKRGRSVALTSAGVAILEAARDVLARARAVDRLGEQLADEWEPRLGVVMDGVLPLPPVMRALRRFTRKGLPTQARVMIEYLSGVGRRFEREEAQIMLALDFLGDPQLQSKRLPPVEMLLLAHKAHPLHALKKPLDRRALSQHVEVSVTDSGGAPGRARRLYVGSPQVLEVSDFHSKRVALRAGVGFGWLPLHLAERSLASGELALVGYEDGDRYTFEPHVVWRRETPLGRGARLFLSLLDRAIRAVKT
jgi:DNA-binding transcriptional LysR family regulator